MSQYNNLMIPESGFPTINSAYDVFGGNPYHTSTLSSHPAGYAPISAIGDDGPIEVVVPASDHYIDLSQTRIHVRYRILKADGSDLGAAANDVPVWPSDLMGQGLFKSIQLHLNDEPMELVEHYPVKAFMDILLNSDKRIRQDKHKITDGMYEDFNTSREGVGLTANVTTTRKGDILASRTLEFLMKPLLSFFETEKVLIPNQKLKLTFTRSSPEFLLTATDGAPDGGSKIKLDSLRLIVKKLTANTALSAIHKKYLTLGHKAQYPLTRSSITPHTIPTGSSNFEATVQTSGQLPERLFIAITTHAGFNGRYAENAYRFGGHDLFKIQVYVDGVMEGEELEMDFGNRLWAKAYVGLMSAINKDQGDTPPFPATEFGLGKAIYGFALRPDLEVGNHLVRRGSLLVKFTFRTATTQMLNAIFYTSKPNLVQLRVDGQFHSSSDSIL